MTTSAAESTSGETEWAASEVAAEPKPAKAKTQKRRKMVRFTGSLLSRTVRAVPCRPFVRRGQLRTATVGERIVSAIVPTSSVLHRHRTRIHRLFSRNPFQRQ